MSADSIRNFALRLVVEVLHQELPVMRRHLTIVLLGDRIYCLFRTTIEHFSFLTKD
jgi:hypothetical protein